MIKLFGYETPVLRQKLKTIVFFTFLFCISSLTFADELLQSKKPHWADNLAGEVSVIVEARLFEKTRSRADLQKKYSDFFKFQLNKLRSVSTHSLIDIETSQFTNPALRSLKVNKDELEQLLQNDELIVYPNQWHSVALDESVPQIFDAQLTSDYSGVGQAVALLDSGVNASHSFLAGAIKQNVAACFSNDNNGAGSPDGGVSLCPDGTDSDNLPDGSFIGAQAAPACDATIAGCDHGTKMAGIIAGSNSLFNGVATGAMIIPIQVFTKSTDEGVCGNAANTPCIGALTSDIIRALEYVSSIASSNDIAAVNVSFGSSAIFQGICDNNPEKVIVDQLSAMNVGVIASSGNNGSVISMTSPACISSVISVASVNSFDVASSFNNRNSELDFFAPGESINSASTPGNAFGNVDGTSAAAAHVAGAWAVLKSKNPNASVGQVRQALVSTGAIVTQGLVAKPRINISLALEALAPPPLVDNNNICFPIKSENSNVAVICL